MFVSDVVSLDMLTHPRSRDFYGCFPQDWPEACEEAISWRYRFLEWLVDTKPPITPEKLAKYMKEHASEIQKNIDNESQKLSAFGDTEGAAALTDLKGKFDPESAGFKSFSETLATPMEHLRADSVTGTNLFDANDAKTIFSDAQQKAIVNRIVQERGADVAGVDLRREFPSTSDRSARDAAVEDQNTKLANLVNAIRTQPEKFKDPFHRPTE